MLEIQTITDSDHMLMTLANAATWVQSEEEFILWSGAEYRFGHVISEFHLGKKPEEVYVAWLNGAAVGYTELHFNSFGRVIARVLCHPQYRGHGIGRQLVDWACERAYISSLIVTLFCVPNNRVAHRLYLNMGFAEHEILVPDDLIRMTKINPKLTMDEIHSNSSSKAFLTMN
ncbi:GNAT family N-acetyltransferase [Limnobacter profundi]|uniref:GNAT family N-acetyltransferase n=1 Tax=Limnobacter profundi TaxID=2732163 RepID=A0ABX6N1S4_9BURK|nr:GNAT family N-acetyltransferase [Limnobacter sp. SAORIC-580]QJR28334.1 GNAT family N-acetyltransferase [Limnobacter sp. SAORIC-580]